MKRKREVKCHMCSYTAKYPCHVKQHMANMHGIGTVQWYHCELCSYKAKFRCVIKQHMANMHGVGTVQWHHCELCSYKTKYKSHLKTHSANRHNIGVKWHQCHLCDLKFKYKTHLKTHLSYVHDIGVTWYKCDHCDFKGKSKGDWKRHLALKHDIGVKWHKCDHCDLKFKENGTLKSHMANIHNLGVKWHQCDHCIYKCKHKGSLKSHLASKHDIGNKYCDICYETVGKTRSIKGADVCRTCCDDYGIRKERIELKYIKALNKRFPYHMEHDTRIQGDMCLRYRPDAMWLDPHLKCHIQFELDEHQHLWKNGSYDCDEKRISDIYDEFKTNVPEHFVVVRLNPDSELGRTAVFKDRLNHLVEVLEHVKTSPPKEKISIIYMYYDKTNHRIAKNLPKYLLDKNHKSI